MAADVNDILHSLGLNKDSELYELLSKLEDYNLVTTDEIRNIQNISVKPLPNIVRNQADALKQRMYGVATDEDYGLPVVINRRMVLLRYILNKFKIEIENLNENLSSWVETIVYEEYKDGFSNYISRRAQRDAKENIIDETYETKEDANTKQQTVAQTINSAKEELKEYTNDRINTLEQSTKNGLKLKADKTEIPTKVSQLTNDADYVNLETLNTYNDNFVDYVDEAISNLVNSAPETLDTLGEVAKALQENENVVDALNESIGKKADKTQIPTKTSQLKNDANFTTEEYVDQAVANINVLDAIETTYDELVALRDNSQLIQGQTYIITDYQCTTTTPNTRSDNHQFDIILTATSENTLSELAKARKHEGDTYFQYSNLDAWELKYSLDNDTTLFEWADEVNGKGVIYYMKDEWDNEVPYDFKNMVFQVKAGFIYNQWGHDYDMERNTSLDIVIGEEQYYGYTADRLINGLSAADVLVKDNPVTTTSTLYKIDGSEISYGGIIVSINNSSYEYYTFYGFDGSGKLFENSIKNTITKGNKITPYYDTKNGRYILKLNRIGVHGGYNTFNECFNTLKYESNDCFNCVYNNIKTPLLINDLLSEINSNIVVVTFSQASSGNIVSHWLDNYNKPVYKYTTNGGETWEKVENAGGKIQKELITEQRIDGEIDGVQQASFNADEMINKSLFWELQNEPEIKYATGKVELNINISNIENLYNSTLNINVEDLGNLGELIINLEMPENYTIIKDNIMETDNGTFLGWRYDYEGGRSFGFRYSIDPGYFAGTIAIKFDQTGFATIYILADGEM